MLKNIGVVDIGVVIIFSFIKCLEFSVDLDYLNEE